MPLPGVPILLRRTAQHGVWSGGRCVQGDGAYLLKAGTLDNPADFGMAQMAIYMCDAQPFHAKPEGIPVFDKAPGQ